MGQKFPPACSLTDADVAFAVQLSAEPSRRCRLCMASGEGDYRMKTLVLDVPDFGFILGTRAALAAGIGLLVGNKLSEERRRVIGGVLVALGAATTLPAAMSVAH